jgi:hypothetical protein
VLRNDRRADTDTQRDTGEGEGGSVSHTSKIESMLASKIRKEHPTKHVSEIRKEPPTKHVSEELSDFQMEAGVVLVCVCVWVGVLMYRYQNT